MEDVVKLALGFGIGYMLGQFGMAGLMTIRFYIRHRRHPSNPDGVDIEAMMEAFRKSYVEDSDGEPTQTEGN